MGRGASAGQSTRVSAFGAKAAPSASSASRNDGARPVVECGGKVETSMRRRHFPPHVRRAKRRLIIRQQGRAQIAIARSCETINTASTSRGGPSLTDCRRGQNGEALSWRAPDPREFGRDERHSIFAGKCPIANCHAGLLDTVARAACRDDKSFASLPHCFTA